MLLAVILFVVALFFLKEQDVARKKEHFESENYMMDIFEKRESGDIDLGFTPEEFKNAYDKSFIDEPQIIRVKERKSSVDYYLDNGMTIGGEINAYGRISFLIFGGDEDYAYIRLEKPLKKFLYGVNKLYVFESYGIEKFLRTPSEKHYFTFIGNIVLSKISISSLYEDDLTTNNNQGQIFVEIIP